MPPRVKVPPPAYRRSWYSTWKLSWSDWWHKRQVVGVDEHGNKFLHWYEKDLRGATFEKREVRWNNYHMYYDPDMLAPEWRQWLRKQRDTAPTPEELARTVQQRADMAAKVAVLEEQERQRRLRMQMMGQQAGPAAAAPDMNRLLQQMGHEPAPAKPPGHGSGASFKPDSWQPGSAARSAGSEPKR